MFYWAPGQVCSFQQKLCLFPNAANCKQSLTADMNPFSQVSGLTSQQVDSIFTEYADKGVEVWRSPKKESHEGVMKNFLTYSMHRAGVSTACFAVHLLTLIMSLK